MLIDSSVSNLTRASYTIRTITKVAGRPTKSDHEYGGQFLGLEKGGVRQLFPGGSFNEVI